MEVQLGIEPAVHEEHVAYLSDGVVLPQPAAVYTLGSEGVAPLEESQGVLGHPLLARSVVEQELSEGHDIVLEIDVQGAEAVRAAFDCDSVVSVFILPPSFEVLRARLNARMTERQEELELRLANARGEVEQYEHFDYIVLNDEVERAAAQLSGIVLAERARRTRQEWVARRVLATFAAVPPRVE